MTKPPTRTEPVTPTSGASSPAIGTGPPERRPDEGFIVEQMLKTMASHLPVGFYSDDDIAAVRKAVGQAILDGR